MKWDRNKNTSEWETGKDVPELKVKVVRSWEVFEERSFGNEEETPWKGIEREGEDGGSIGKARKCRADAPPAWLMLLGHDR